MNNEIAVSIICTAYNHAHYIRQCLDSFVAQKTNFVFEVLVNDDASTDQTATIIREYEQAYPNIIKPVYQTENQYSKGVRITSDILFPLVKGKYVAFCEGDDWWSDPLKLQKQYDAMEQHPECCLCAHSVEHCSEQGISLQKHQPVRMIMSGIYSSREQLCWISGLNSPQTSSYFFRKEILGDLFQKNPAFRANCMVGDIPMLMFSASIGPAVYINQPMSCYRENSLSSWTVQFYEKDLQHQVKLNENLIETYKSFDEFTNGTYHDLCTQGIWAHRRLIALKTNAKKDYTRLIWEDLPCFMKQPLRVKTSIISSAYFPWVIKTFRIVRERLLYGEQTKPTEK